MRIKSGFEIPSVLRVDDHRSKNQCHRSKELRKIGRRGFPFSNICRVWTLHIAHNDVVAKSSSYIVLVWVRVFLKKRLLLVTDVSTTLAEVIFKVK